MGKEEELKITKLSMLVELNNGKVYQLITTSENRDMYLEVIEQYEKGIKLIEAPLEDIEIKTKINKFELAKNPNTLAETLSKLAKDEDWVVRSYAASNQNTPKKQRDEKRVKNKSI